MHIAPAPSVHLQNQNLKLVYLRRPAPSRPNPIRIYNIRFTSPFSSFISLNQILVYLEIEMDRKRVRRQSRRGDVPRCAPVADPFFFLKAPFLPLPSASRLQSTARRLFKSTE